MEREHGLPRADALALASVVVDLRVTQVVNEVLGVHAVLRDDAFGERAAAALARAAARTGYRLRDAATGEPVRWEDPRIRVVPAAGVSYRPEALPDPSFDPGQRLALVPEPENEHDPNAVAIWNAERTLQLGYVPRRGRARARRRRAGGLALARRRRAARPDRPRRRLGRAPAVGSSAVAYEFKLPDLGEGLTEGEVARWLVDRGPGDRRGRPARRDPDRQDDGRDPVAGRGHGDADPGRRGRGRPGRHGARRDRRQRRRAVPPPRSPRRAPVAAPRRESVVSTQSRVQATPLVRRIAQELGVDLAQLSGTGPNGRITEDDVRDAAR